MTRMGKAIDDSNSRQGFRLSGRCRAVLALAACAAGLATSCVQAQTPQHGGVALSTVVDLALRNSPEVRIAESDIKHAAAGLAEQRDAYLPNFAFSSNLGYSYGFPVGQPSVASAQSNSLVFSFSQPDYIRSARLATDAARFALVDTREKVALEAATDYIELSTDTQEIATLRDQQALGEHLIRIEEERFAAGLDSHVDETQARLTNARLELRLIQLEGHADVLADKLANLTGLPLESIAADPSTIPPPPDDPQLVEVVHQSSGLQAAFASAKSKQYVAFGDSRQNFRPTFAMGAQYSRYAEFNNYQSYYLRFQHNNFEVGVNITIPVFDEARRDHARGSAADAVHATAQAEQQRNTETEQKLELSKNLRTLAAQQKVAELQHELAQDQLDAATLQMQNGTGRPGAPPVTPKEQQLARIDERRYTVDVLDAKFQLLQAELNLLRANGQMVTWAMQSAKP
jgi:outer membrane protein TolC